MAYTEEELKKQLETKEYEYGFYTDIDSETFPVGLSEEIVVAISNKKNDVNFIHSSWNFSSNYKKHKVHLGILKRTSNRKKTLTQLLKNVKKNIDFIKIDVDGYEIDVLKSGKKVIKKYKPIIYFEFAPYLYKEFGYSTKILIDYVKKDLNYLFFDEDFNEIKNIYEVGKNLKNRSENFFLIHKKKISVIKNI